MTEDKDKLGRFLAGELKLRNGESCPSAEDIAALAEGRLQGAERDRLLRHVSSCADCYDVYMLTMKLTRPQVKIRSTIFRPLAMAASVLIIVASVFVVYRSGLQLKRDDASLPMVEQAESKSVGRLAEEFRQSPEKKEIAKDSTATPPAPVVAVPQKAQSRKKAKAVEKKEFDDAADRFSTGLASAAKPVVRESQEAQKLENEAPPADKGEIQESEAHLRDGREIAKADELKTGKKREKEAVRTRLQHREEAKVASSEVLPDVPRLLEKSPPDTIQREFAQLAMKGYFYSGSWHPAATGIPSAESIEKWKNLLPRLTGIYREIAIQTIREFENLSERR